MKKSVTLGADRRPISGRRERGVVERQLLTEGLIADAWASHDGIVFLAFDADEVAERLGTARVIVLQSRWTRHEIDDMEQRVGRLPGLVSVGSDITVDGQYVVVATVKDASFLPESNGSDLLRVELAAS